MGAAEQTAIMASYLLLLSQAVLALHCIFGQWRELERQGTEERAEQK
jgi:hypothetical protein